jgi:hypothetical protein
MTTLPSRRTHTTVVERILLWFFEGFTDLPDTIGTISNYTAQKACIYSLKIDLAPGGFRGKQGQ